MEPAALPDVADLSLPEAALAYARAGIPVFPLAQRSKRPIHLGGFTQATTDLDQVRTWWADSPGANIGAVPGKVGCIVPDIDSTEARRAWFEHVAVETSSTQTGGGIGVHPWYRSPALAQRSHWRLDERGGPFEDSRLANLLFRASGGYVVVAPSVHPDTGNPYRLANPQAAIADLPADIEAKLAQVQSRLAGGTHTVSKPQAEEWFKQNSKPQTSEGGQAVLKARLARIADSPKDSRNDTLMAEVGILLNSAYRWAINLEEAREAVRAVYVPHVADARKSQQANREVDHAFDYVATQRYWEGPLDDGSLDLHVTANIGQVAQTFPNPQTPEDRRRAAVADLIDVAPLDLGALLRGEVPQVDWLVKDILPARRLVSIVAEAKAGKSLLLFDMVAALCAGVEIFGQKRPPIKVLYLDYEMVPEDVADRLFSMGYGDDEATAALLLDNLIYWQTPPIPPLDTEDGGAILVEAAQQLEVDVVVVDTTAAAVQGAENDSDTFRAARQYTWTPLKAAGITAVRTDHLGKDRGRGARGSSMKRDDVDLGWELTKISGQDDRLILKRLQTRLQGVGEQVLIERLRNPLRHVRYGTKVWATSEIALAREIVRAGIDIDAPGRLRDKLKHANIVFDHQHLAGARAYIEEGMPSVDAKMETPVQDSRAKIKAPDAAPKVSNRRLPGIPKEVT